MSKNVDAESTVVILARGEPVDPREAVPSTMRSAGFCLKIDPVLLKYSALLKSAEQLSVMAVSAEVSEAVEQVEDAEDWGSVMDNDGVWALEGMINGVLEDV